MLPCNDYRTMPVQRLAGKYRSFSACSLTGSLIGLPIIMRPAGEAGRRVPQSNPAARPLENRQVRSYDSLSSGEFQGIGVDV
jgi:hypothetical protein